MRSKKDTIQPWLSLMSKLILEGIISPQNFDGVFRGPVSVRKSLNESLNIPAIKMADLTGPQTVIDLANKAGMNLQGDAQQHGVAIGVGVGEVLPLYLINAYQSLATDGTISPPLGILEIHNSEGKILESHHVAKKEPKTLFSSDTAALVRSILTDEETRPTTDDFDWNRLLQIPHTNNGAKTGTSNRNIENPDWDETKPTDAEDNPERISVPSDSWTIGFTPAFSAGVWVGNNRGQPMKSGATGLRVAAPIWKQIMIAANEKYPSETLSTPDELDPNFAKNQAETKFPHYPRSEIKQQKFNRWSGQIATDQTPSHLVVEDWVANHTKLELDQSVQEQIFDRRTGRLATPQTPSYAQENRLDLTLHSARPTVSGWEAPVQDWLKNHPLFRSSLGKITDPQPKDAPHQTDFRENDSFFLSRRPRVDIISPRTQGRVSSGLVEVQAKIDSRFDLQSVDFLVDGVWQMSQTAPPWSGVIYLPPSSQTSHQIEVRATDRLGMTGSDRIRVLIGQDTTPPSLDILGLPTIIPCLPSGRFKPLPKTPKVPWRWLNFGSMTP